MVTKLSYAEDISDVIINKIKKLKEEINNLNNELINTNNDINSKSNSLANLELIESLLNECKEIDKLSRESQKRIIDILIDKIYWYGKDNRRTTNFVVYITIIFCSVKNYFYSVIFSIPIDFICGS